MIYSILIIDDHPLIRRGIKDLISMDKAFSVIGEADNGVTGIELARNSNPNIILLDFNMKPLNGLQVLEQLKTKQIKSHIVMLTVSNDQQNIIASIRAGASGYLLKDMEPDDMLAQFHKVMQGEIAISPQLSNLIIHGLHKESLESDRENARLTNREDEILHFIAKGLTNKEIAKELGIVETTVKVHVKHLLQKLKCRTRVEAAVWVVLKNK
jgi:two-component system, NarL family, nitrate/nitrite response regulator NarL